MHKLVTVSAFVTSFLVCGAVAAASNDVPFDALPAAVKATIQKEVKGGSILDIERDTKGGKPIFEVEFVDAGVEWELHVAPDGALLLRKQD